MEQKIISIFEAAQNSASSHKVNASKLITIVQNESASQDALNFILRACLDRALLCPKKEPAVERVLKFFCGFLASEDIPTPIFKSGLTHLVKRSKATEKTIRQQACRTIHMIFDAFTSEVDDDIWDLIVKGMRTRLKDKIPSVRVNAIKALSKFQIDDVDGKEDAVTADFKRLMKSDISTEVRIAAIECIRMGPHVITDIVERTKDIDKAVRISAFLRLEEVSLGHLPEALRAVVIGYGLNDREDTVRRGAIKLVLKWLDGIQNNVPKLLNMAGLRKFEEEVSTLATSIIKEIEEGEYVPGDLTRSVRETCPDWSRGLSSLKPNEVYWALMRCAYAVQHFSPRDRAELTSLLIPDTVVVCDILREVDLTMEISEKASNTIYYLLRMMTFMDTSDVTGCNQLVVVCTSLLTNPDLPFDLVEPALMAWKSGYMQGSQRDIVLPLLQISSQVLAQIKDIEGSDDMSTEDEEDLVYFRHRAIVIFNWGLQQSIGSNSQLSEEGKAILVELEKVLWACLEHVDPNLRMLSANCLGLLSLYQESACDAVYDVMPQIIGLEGIESEVRANALQVVIDMAIVYPARFKDDAQLIHRLLRILESAPPSVQRVAAEGAAKLLFAGTLSEPRLFANLLKFFFLPDLTSDECNESDEDDDGQRESYHTNTLLGSQPRLSQMLSIFFHAFLAAGKERLDVVLHSIPSLILDLAMLVRAGEAHISALQKISNHLIGMSDSVKVSSKEEKAATVAAFHCRLAAAVARELLKLGTSRSEKAIAKEYVKVFCAQDPEKWLEADTVPVVLQLVEKLVKSLDLDKTTNKSLEKFAHACKQCLHRVTATIEEPLPGATDDARFRFLDLAPGLAELADFDDDEEENDGESDEDEEFSVSSAPGLAPPRSKGAAGPKGRGKGVAHTAIPSRAPTPARGAALTARSKILAQVPMTEDVDDEVELEAHSLASDSDHGDDDDEDEHEDLGGALQATSIGGGSEIGAGAGSRKQTHSNMQQQSAAPVTPTVKPPASKKSKKLVASPALREGDERDGDGVEFDADEEDAENIPVQHARARDRA